METHNHYFKITGDIDIHGKTPMEKAWRPSLLFLEGNLNHDLINRIILTISLTGLDRISVPLTEDYAFQTGYGEYIVEYNKLKMCNFSDHTLSINTKELIENLMVSKNSESKSLFKDNSIFLETILESTLKKIKDNNEFN